MLILEIGIKEETLVEGVKSISCLSNFIYIITPLGQSQDNQVAAV